MVVENVGVWKFIEWSNPIEKTIRQSRRTLSEWVLASRNMKLILDRE